MITCHMAYPPPYFTLSTSMTLLLDFHSFPALNVFVWYLVNKITYARNTTAGTRASNWKASSLAVRCSK